MFNRREDAELFVEEVLGDEPEIAEKLRIEKRELRSGRAELRHGRTEKARRSGPSVVPLPLGP